MMIIGRGTALFYVCARHGTNLAINAVEQIRKNAEQLTKADTIKNKTDMER